jgi:FMN phosphatase YigB (HAD superfamily)
MPLSAALKYITMNAGLRFDISMAEQEEIFDRYNSDRRVFDGISELFDAMKENGIRLAIISNNAMSGEGLALAIKRWIPNAEPEFVLTSADLLFAKPDKSIFIAAANYAQLDPADCWYCGDGRVPDVDGSFNSGMVPVFYDRSSSASTEIRDDGGRGAYLAINHWNELTKIIMK